MADLLKDMYNEAFIDEMVSVLKLSILIPKENTFKLKFHSHEWNRLELKQRISFLAIETDKLLPKNFEQKVDALFKWVDNLKKTGVKDQNFIYIFIPEIILNNGLEHLHTSIIAMEKVTVLTSFEFAVRPFIIRYPKEMMAQLILWSQHPNENVRRFSTEACRPRLPWGLQLKDFVADPTPIIPILENLKEDQSEYVRRSVANNINDISKDHPEKIVSLIKKWKGNHKHTDWIIKHGARSLLKNGHPEILEVFGSSPITPSILTDFTINTSVIHLGECLSFEFKLENKSQTDALFRLEYFIYYMKSIGKQSKKIFKISETLLKPDVVSHYKKNHRFIDLTTRKHYAGIHKISIVVNGIEKSSLDFELIKK